MNPKENIFRIKFRKPLDRLIVKLPFPKINPDYVSYSTILTTIISVIFFINREMWWFWSFLLITLILDWADGTIARKYNLETEKGWLLDKIIDRISETILFSVIWIPGLLFVLLNIAMMIMSYKGKYPLILMFIPPLRVVLLIVYLFILLMA